ncbi:MAG TPA: hypothetical protein PLU47_08500 [Azonexus sp.]|nr:hypothetical protein [Azonexus sp.]
MTEPFAGGTYIIELCSGELRRWRYLGPDARSQIWWRDVESGREFTESSVMYAWQIVRKQDD